MAESIKTATEVVGLRNFGDLPDEAFVRQPVVEALFGYSHATLWRRVRDESLPAPCKLGPRLNGWRVGDLRAVLAATAAA